MTAFCGGNTSSPKPGVVDLLIYSAGASGVLSPVPGWEWLLPFLPLLGNLAYHTPDFCAGEPPPLNQLTADEVIALTGSVPSAAYLSGLQKLEDFVGHYAWLLACQCDAGPQPGPMAPPTAPITVSYQSPGTQAKPCLSFDWPPIELSDNASFARDGVSFGARPITSARITVSAIYVSGTHGGSIGFNFEQETCHTPLQTYRSLPMSAAEGQTVVQDWDIEEHGDDCLVLTVVGGMLPQTTMTWTAHVDFYCGSAPAAQLQPCCPPDANLLQLLTHIQQQVDLIQRQRVPFAYVPGTAHANLSGSGELVIAGLIGVKVEYAVPQTAGVVFGDPDQVYDIGWLSVGTVDGWTPKQWITHAPFLWFPDEMSAATKLGYTLLPGVTATITELSREP